MPAPVIDVVAGVLVDDAGRVLLAERPAGRHLAGLWEFPGGKREPGETPIDALRRELREEIGVELVSAEPLIRVPHDYPDKRIALDVQRVTAFRGRIHAREGQRLAWIAIDDLDVDAMPRADRPVVAALRLPDRMLITPAVEPAAMPSVLAGIERAVDAGVELIQLRQRWPQQVLFECAERARKVCASRHARLIVNADPGLAVELAVDGVHLSAARARMLRERPLARPMIVGVSCHDESELAHARAIDADYATLSPVASTPSHPDVDPLGWPRFAALAREAGLPVYALGGVGVADIATARASGGRGIAAIRALWPDSTPTR